MYWGVWSSLDQLMYSDTKDTQDDTGNGEFLVVVADLYDIHESNKAIGDLLRVELYLV